MAKKNKTKKNYGNWFNTKTGAKDTYGENARVEYDESTGRSTVYFEDGRTATIGPSHTTQRGNYKGYAGEKPAVQQTVDQNRDTETVKPTVTQDRDKEKNEETVRLQQDQKAWEDGATATSPNRLGVDLIGNVNRSGRFNVRKAASETQTATMNGKTAADFPTMDTDSAKLKIGKWDIDEGNIGNVSGPESATIPQDLMQAAWDEYLQTAVPRGAANVTGTGKTDIQGALEAMQGWTEDYWNTAATDGARATNRQTGTGNVSGGSTNLQGARNLMQRATENYWNTAGRKTQETTEEPENNQELEYEMSRYNGNVDLLNRPQIKAEELAKKGWQDAGEGTATVFSSTYERQIGNTHLGINLTPILANGEVLSENELNDYFDMLVNGAASTNEIKRRDAQENGGLGLLLNVVEADSEEEAINQAVEMAEQLHVLQEDYYMTDNGSRGYQPSFLDRSAMAQLEDENSKLNQVARWRNSAPRIHDRYTVQDEQDWAEWEQEGIRLGQYNQGDDYRKWNGEKLEREIKELQDEIETKGKVEAPTEEKREAAGVRLNQIQEEKGKYLSLERNGLDDWEHGRTLKGKPEDYEDYEYEYDSLLYDFIHGDGAYYRALNEGTDAEAEQAIEETEELWRRLENGTIGQMAEEDEELNREEQALMDLRSGDDRDTRQAENLLRRYQTRLDNLNRQDELIRNANGDTSYHPELIEKPDIVLNVQNDDPEKVKLNAKGDRTDQAYYFINNSWQDSMADEQLAGSPYAYNLADVYNLTGDSRPEDYYNNIRAEYFLTDGERDVFNSYYNAGDKESAQAFLDGLQDTLDSRRTDYFMEVTREKSSGKDEGEVMGAVYGLLSVPENVLAGFTGLVNTARALFGDESVLNPKSGNWIWQNTVNATRDERGKQWGEWAVQLTGNEGARDVGTWLNGIAYSMLDNLMASGVAGASYGEASKLTEGIIQLVMSSEATSSSMLQAISEGKDPTEAAIYAIGDGVIEAMTEKFDWLETDARDLMGSKGDLIRFLATAATEEGIEEVESDVLGSVFDGVMSLINGHKTEIEDEVDALVDQGMNRGDAENQVLKNYFRDLGISFLGGALSGIGLSGSNVTMTKVGTVFDTRRNAAAAIENDNIGTILQAARGVQGSEEYNQKVEELAGKYEKNGTLSTQEAVTLFKIMRQTNNTMAEEAAKDEAVNVLKEEILAKLEQTGERADGAQVTAAAQGAAELLTGEGKLNAEQKEALAQIPGAMDVIQEVISAGTAANEKARTRIQEATEPYRVSENSIREAGRKWQASSGAQAAAENARVATAEEKQAASGKSTGSATEVIADGEYADIIRKEGDSYVVRTSEGTEKTVDAADVIATGSTAATIMKWGENNRHAVSDTFINTALNMSKTGAIQDTAKFLDQAMGIRLAAYTGQAMPQTSMRTEIAQALYSTSLKDAQADRKTATARQTERRQTGGRATFDGAEYGTADWDTAMKKAGLTRQQRTQADALAEIYQRIGLDVNFENDTENDGVYGAYNAETGVTTINLAGTNANGEQHHAMVTAGHELTHFLEQNGGEAYDQLRQYVFDSMKQHGLNINQAVMNKMDRYNAAFQEQGSEQTIGIDGAIAEIIADSCDQILGNENVIRHIEETKPTLYNSIKNFVSNFIEKVRDAFAGMSRSASRESLNFLRDSNELARKWLGAYDSAISQQIRQAETGADAETARAAETGTAEDVTEAGTEEKFSIRESATERINRISENRATIEETISEQWTDGSEKTVQEVMDLVGNSDYTVYQWLHNTFEKGRSGNQITKDQLLEFLKQDENRIQDGAESVSTGWGNLINNHATVTPVDATEEVEKSNRLRTNVNYITSRLFGEDSNTSYINEDTGAKIRVDTNTIKESLIYNDKNGINYNQSAQILNKTKELLEGAYYVGSHINYAHPNSNVHYLVNAADTGKQNNAVIFAVHDATDQNQALRFSERAYVAEIQIINEKEGATTHHVGAGIEDTGVGTMATHRTAPSSETSIEDLIQSVNPDRIRFFDKSKLTGKALQLSVRQMDTEYSEAVRNGDTETAQALVDQAAEAAFKDSKVRDADGKLMKVYHGTQADFTVFDTEKFGGANGIQEGYGIYLTDNPKVSESYGGRQIAAYADIKRPAYGNKLTVKKSELSKVIKAMCEKEAQIKVEEEEYGSVKEALPDTWISNYVYTPDFPNINAAYAEVAKQILDINDNDADVIGELIAGAAIRDYGEAMSFYNEILTPITGIDGIWQKWNERGQGVGANVILAFNSNQIKYADAVTYDDDGNVIPLNERFNTEKEDIRYSLRIEGDADVIGWMDGLTEEELGSETERTMLREYRNLQGQIAESREKTNNFLTRLNQVRQVMADQWEGNDEFIGWTPGQLRDEARKMEINLQTEAGRMERLQNELGLTTTGQGYASLMYRQNHIVNDYITGNTKEMVQKTVSDMMTQIRNTREEINQRAERLKTLAENKDVAFTRSFFAESNLKESAAELKKMYQSRMSGQEIQDRLASIAMKMAARKDFTAEASDLAARLIDTRKGEGAESYILDSLRGTTIRLNATQLKNMKAEHRTIREVRSILAGTGIRIETGGDTLNTLDKNWDSLCDIVPTLHRDAPDTDMLNELLDVIQGEKQLSQAREELTGEAYQEALSDAMTEVMGRAALMKPNMPTDAGSRRQIQQMAKYMSQLAMEAEDSAAALAQMQARMDELEQSGAKARATASWLQRDLNKAVEYYDTLVKQSMDAKANRERQELIDKLNSRATEALLKQEAKYKQQIERSKKVRELAEEKKKIRKQISTVTGRIRKLLVNETDQKNVPEHMKPLAREALRMIIDNDLGAYGGRKITGFDSNMILDTKRVLDAWTEQDGKFDGSQLEFTDKDIREQMLDALADIEDGIMFYNSGKGYNETQLFSEKSALQRVQQGLNEIYGVIQSERSIWLNDKRVEVEDQADKVNEEMKGSRFKGEWIGSLGSRIGKAREVVVYGNMTPEYFFKNLKNAGMLELWDEYHRGENRNGLLIQSAKDRLAEIAEKHGYAGWDLTSRKDIKLEHGGTVRLNTEQIMSLYATWKREMTYGPENSSHLTQGGFFADEGQDENRKIGREIREAKAKRVTGNDMEQIETMLTDEQKAYVDEIVGYLSKDMSELGNEASMKMYGIKKYKEKYYFPFKTWDGVKSVKSDAGVAGNTENRAAHKSWSNRRVNNAKTPVVIEGFTQTAAQHVVEMINYNTMAVAIENMNKVLNVQFTETESGVLNGPDATKRNLRTIFGEKYGSAAIEYLTTLQKDLNGGVGQKDSRKTLKEALLSTFRKNAVAGSLSVALQQPMSYLRAGMMINPKYLARALSPDMWKGSWQEMISHSGVAVIKEMGRFDMNFGRTAREYIQPENTKTDSRIKKAGAWISDTSTMLPELMDRMTWTRMWSACKAEQAAAHPEMDKSSDAFLDLVGERFNDVMRKTQVYESILVRSANMRKTDSYAMKTLTSFMAEPTLSINVLVDAILNAGEKGGKAYLTKAAAIYMMSAAAQAIIKGFFSAGRTPDDKKTEKENILNKIAFNFVSEINPLGMIPGYNDILEALTQGKLTDNAMSVVGKLKDIKTATINLITGEDKYSPYRYVEDSLGQLMQIISGVPGKNIMRDTRAVYNLLSGKPYNKDRETSADVIKWQAIDTLNSNDILGAVNEWLGKAGYQTSNEAYYERIYQAQKAGDTAAAESMRNYMRLAKGIDDQGIDSKIKSAIKKDESLSYEERINALKEEGMKDSNVASWILSEYKEGNLTREEAEKEYRKANPDKTDNDVFFAFDEADFEAETGESVDATYYRLDAALEANDVQQVRAAMQILTEHGVKEGNAAGEVVKEYKKGKISRENALSFYRIVNPSATDDDVYWAFDKVDFEKETGTSVSGKYYRLDEALEANDAQQVRAAMQTLTVHGVKESEAAGEVANEYAEGKITRANAEKLYKIVNPQATDEDVFYAFDRKDFKVETGKTPGSNEKYYRLYDAIDNNKAEKITEQVKAATSRGAKAKDLKSTITSRYKKQYLELKSGSAEKVKMKDALIKAYKALGMTGSEAEALINGWKKSDK